MKLNKSLICAVCFCLCFVTSGLSGCGNYRAEKERLAAEQAAEAERIAAEEAAAKAKAEEEARKAAEKAAEDAEKERLFNELSSMSLVDIVENNDFDFSVDNNIKIYNGGNGWACSFEGGSRSPVFLHSEIEDDVLSIYYSNETADVTFKESENGRDYNHPSYINYRYYQTKKFSITKNQLISYMTDKGYKLPDVVDCDAYDDSIQYFNPVNNIKAVVVADFANVRDEPRGAGDIHNVAKLNQWDEVMLLGRTNLSASLDGTKEEPFYLIAVENENGEIVPGWIHGNLIKIFRNNYYNGISDLERLKLHFSDEDFPVLVPGVDYSGRKVIIQGNLLAYYGYDENNPVIDSIESFLNYYTDGELDDVKEFYVDFADPEMGNLNPALAEAGYGELPSLEGIERIKNLEKLHICDSVHMKSLKGLEKLENLKVLVVNYDCLGDDDKSFLEPFKTDVNGKFYFNGYKGDDDKNIVKAADDVSDASDVSDVSDVSDDGVSSDDSNDGIDDYGLMAEGLVPKIDDDYYNSFITEDNVYVKTGISRDDKIMTVINKGEKVHVLSKSEEAAAGDDEDFWCMVELRNGVKGWIFGAYIYDLYDGNKVLDKTETDDVNNDVNEDVDIEPEVIESYN